MTDHEISRRRLLGTGATAAAGALVSGAAPADAKARHAHAPRRRRRRADVIVVGAGLAGLTAARRVAAAGRSVIVVEARNRVGGRVWAHDLGGGAVSERGGTFIGPTQDHLLDLAKTLGVPTFDVYDEGQNVYIDGDGARSTYSDTGPTGTAPLDPAILPELTVAVSRLDDMSTTVPVGAPWTAPKAAEYDAQTLESWIRANSSSQRFQQLVPLATRPIFGAEPGELSLLYVLFYIASSGNEQNPGTFERNFNTRGGAQQSRFVGGSQRIPQGMASQVGRALVLRSPVHRIVQSGSRVDVVCNRATYRGKRVIVAVPPALAGRIDYHPLLPSERDQLTQRLFQGALTKVAAVYDRPFWRDKGLTGQGLSPTGLISATFDDSPPSGDPGVLFGFVGGNQSRRYGRLTAGERRAQILAELAAFFGPEALQPQAFFDTVWTQEKWTRGSPVGLGGPGTLTGYGPALRTPVGRVHWAGTETSDYWNGYMDGAVRSGERAAREVLADL